MPTALPADLGRRTLVMGILNVTPDSFSDGGRFDRPDAALAQAAAMVAEGADILDVGGESTRPGSEPVSEEEEIARVVPVIAALSARHGLPISIDTYKATTAEAALKAGARVVNDVWGLRRDPDIAAVAAAHGAPVVAMHNRTEADPAIDIVADVMRAFEASIAVARRAGIADDDIVLDPGIGFGKTFEQNLDILARLAELKTLGHPILIGLSRKRFIGRLTGREIASERLFGTLAADAAAVLAGADIIRVHDVAAHVEAVRVLDAIKERRP